MELQGMVYILSNFGGLGLIALFAWVLLRSTMKQQRDLTTALTNHLATDLQVQQKLVDILGELEKNFREHWGEWRTHDKDTRS